MKELDFLCPRRVEVPPQAYFPDKDKWTSRLGVFGSTCSFCGSMSPESLFVLMTTLGVQLGPTDKNYKIYVKPDESLGYREGKFYFQHFDEPQMLRFIEILNGRHPKVSIGYPGFFYVLPFFMQKGVNDGS